MRAVARLLMLAVFIAALTVLVDWWTVPLVGLLWGAVAVPGTRPVLSAGGGAALGWGVLLAWTAVHGHVFVLAQKVGPIFHLPAWGLIAATILFPALLAGGAAGLVARPSPGRRVGWSTSVSPTTRV